MHLPRNLLRGTLAACALSGLLALPGCNRSSIADSPYPIGEETQDLQGSASYESGVLESEGSPAEEAADATDPTDHASPPRRSSSPAREDFASISGSPSELTQAAGQELARAVFDAVERGDKTAFLQKVTCFDAESIWGKVTRVKGRWEVDASPTGPQTVEVDTDFSAPETTGTFEKTYTWRLVWDEGWKIVDWMR